MLGHEKAIQLLKKHEGFEGKPYKDTVGKTTIGFGRNLEANPLTKEEGEYLLRNDIEEVVSQLHTHLPWWRHLSAARRDVLIDMCYNLGIYGLLGFKKFLQALKSGDYKLAAKEGLDSKWATQVGYRAEDLMKIIEIGDHIW